MFRIASQKVDALGALLEELDASAGAAIRRSPTDVAGQPPESRRQHPRQRFRCNCTVRFFGSTAREIASLPGRTRNLSQGGVSLLTRRAFGQGEVVELELELANGPSTFLSGEVRFSRPVGGGFYEVGVRIRAATAEPAFSHDPAAAIAALDWVRDAKRPV